MKLRRWRGIGWAICVCMVASIAVLASAAVPAQAASPVLEFVSPGSAFPIGFTASGGQVTAALADFETVVNCSGSSGAGQVNGPTSTLSSWVFTGCKAQGGSENGHKCKSPGAAEEEIKAGPIAARLVYLNQAQHQVGMLLNPQNGIYMTFECGGEAVAARGPFLSPVGPVNQEATSFTATLSRSGALQIPNEFENPDGEKLQAIPFGERGVNPPATTGVELSFAITTSAPLTIKALTAVEAEAKEREEAAAVAAARKRQEEEAARAAAAKKHQEEDAAAAAAAKKRQEEDAAAAAAAKLRQQEEARKARSRAQHLAKALRQCRRVQADHRRTRCESRAKKKFTARH